MPPVRYVLHFHRHGVHPSNPWSNTNIQSNHLPFGTAGPLYIKLVIIISTIIYRVRSKCEQKIVLGQRRVLNPAMSEHDAINNSVDVSQTVANAVPNIRNDAIYANAAQTHPSSLSICTKSGNYCVMPDFSHDC